MNKRSPFNQMNLESFSKAEALKKRLLFVILILIVCRIGSYIPLPGIDAQVLKEVAEQNAGGILDMFNMLSGGSLERMTIFALSIFPYITASIIIQLLTVVSKNLEALKKEGESGRRKINQYTRQATVLLATIQAFGIAVGLENMSGFSTPVVLDPGLVFRVTTVITLVTGTLFVMWLGEQINAKGIGNGISLIIFTGIVAGLPRAVISMFELARTGALSPYFIILILALAIGLVVFIVFMERAHRKIVVHYPKRQVGKKMYGEQSTHLPLKLNMSGVIPAIFASSILLFPLTIANFSTGEGDSILDMVVLYLGHGKPLYNILYVAFIVFFCFFYTAVVFNPDETAENLKKNGAVVPGKRPGALTAKFMDHVLTRLTVVGAAYISFVCIIPELMISQFSVPFYLGGTSILIVVNVLMDTITQIQTHLYAHQYEGLMKKARLRTKKA